MDNIVIGVLGIVILLVLLFNGMNIGVAMLGVGFVGYAIVTKFSGAIGILSTVPSTQAASYTLVVIPLFIMLGNFAYVSGMSTGLFDFADKWLSRVPGGLACASLAACAGFGAICGSVQATAATIGTIAVPEMRKHGYKDTLSLGAVSVGGTLGIMIPPSTPMIIYGMLSMESIGQLFMAGVFPGILECVLCCLTVVIWTKVSKGTAPPSQKVRWIDRLKAIKGFIPILIVFAVIFGGMMTGIFSVNECAAIGAGLGILFTIIMGNFNKKNFIYAMKETVKTTGMTYLVLIGASVFGNFLTITKLPRTIANFIEGLDVSKYVILLFIVLVYFVLGMIMDALPMMMLTVPIFYPIMTDLGFDGVWFGIIIIMVMQLGLITPPVGSSCYVIAGIAKDVSLGTIFKGAYPFVIPLFVSILAITIFPQIALWLPSMMY